MNGGLRGQEQDMGLLALEWEPFFNYRICFVHEYKKRIQTSKAKTFTSEWERIRMLVAGQKKGMKQDIVCVFWLL